MDIKELIKGNVKFVNARKGNLWYVTESGFEFPVPFEDMGDGIFLAEDKGIIFMRYIRKHLQTIEQEKQKE